MCQICKKWKTPTELCTDKLIMSPYVLGIFNLPRQIYHPRYTKISKCTITLDDIFHNHIKDSFFMMLYVKSFPQLVMGKS